jgi:hypothetical protein
MMQSTSYVQLSPKMQQQGHILPERLHVRNILHHCMLHSYTVPSRWDIALALSQLILRQNSMVTHGQLWDHSFCKRVTGLGSMTVPSADALRLIS